MSRSPRTTSPRARSTSSIDVASLDTGDKERDDTLKSADLFDPTKFPKARFVSSKISATGAGRYEAQGKLTIRNVTKDIKLPITFQTKEEKGKQVGYLTGRYTLKRLEYGVGQGDWKSTEWVKDDVSRHLLAEARAGNLKNAAALLGCRCRTRRACAPGALHDGTHLQLRRAQIVDRAHQHLHGMRHRHFDALERGLPDRLREHRHLLVA